VSVGHVQRAIEEAGIPTVGVYVKSFGHVPQLMGVARAVVTKNPMGRPLGAPFDSERQLAVVEAAVRLLETNESAVLEIPDAYRTAPGDLSQG